MTEAYINYPNPHVTIHRLPGCPQVRSHDKPERRHVIVSSDNLGAVLGEFIQGRYSFAANSAENDLWLSVGLDTACQEVGVVHVIQALLAARYRPFKTALVTEHCGE